MKFHGTVLYVDDVAEVMTFYRRAFGFETRHLDEQLGYGELDTGDTLLAIASHALGESLAPGGHTRPAEGHPTGVELAFRTNDVDAALARAISAGAASVSAPKEIPGGWTAAYVRSVEGTLVCLCSPPAEEQ